MSGRAVAPEECPTRTMVLSLPLLYSAAASSASEDQETKMAKAYLEITLKVSATDRPKAGAVYSKYKQPFLATITGAESKDLLLREEDVQVLHGFDSKASAENYLTSPLFGNDVVEGLKPYLTADPEIRIYESV